MTQRQASKHNANQKQSTKRPEKLTLHPVEFEDALAAFLNTPPPNRPTSKKKVSQKKRTAKKKASR